jgi:hypothetical protein
VVCVFVYWVFLGLRELQLRYATDMIRNVESSTFGNDGK